MQLSVIWLFGLHFKTFPVWIYLHFSAQPCSSESCSCIIKSCSLEGAIVTFSLYNPTLALLGRAATITKQVKNIESTSECVILTDINYNY